MVFLSLIYFYSKLYINFYFTMNYYYVQLKFQNPFHNYLMKYCFTSCYETIHCWNEYIELAKINLFYPLRNH